MFAYPNFLNGVNDRRRQVQVFIVLSFVRTMTIPFPGPDRKFVPCPDMQAVGMDRKLGCLQVAVEALP